MTEVNAKEDGKMAKTSVAAKKVKEIFPTESEKASGKFESNNAQEVLEGLHADGIIIIRDIIDPAHLDTLNEVMVPETDHLCKTAHFNFQTRNIQHAPPLLPPSLVFDDMYLNSLLLHAVTLYLGPNPQFNFISGNTALPNGSTRQPVHCDLSFKYPEFPFYVIANIPLITATPEVGCTEFWPCTHLRPFSDQLEPKFYEIQKERLEGYACLQPEVPKGSVVLRDLRLWHAGMPNPSNTCRCMIGLAYCSSWYRTKYTVPVPDSVFGHLSDGLKKLGVVPLLKSLPDDEYLKKKDEYTFTFKQDEEMGIAPQYGEEKKMMN